MTMEAVLPLAIIATSLLAALLTFPLEEQQARLRIAINLSGAVLKLVLVAVMVLAAMKGTLFESRLPFLPGIDLVFRADFLALLFVSLSAVLWLVTTAYAIAYLQDSPHRSRFFGFFSLCVTATMGIALAGNLITFFIFYEMLTLVTYPLVVHRGTAASLNAGRVYLLYTLGGGIALLVGIAWLHGIAGPVEFTSGGVLEPFGEAHRATLITIFALLMAGLGVKAAIVPLHGWLPQSMVAPAPVSALLHAVAVVKAGAFGIVRVVYDVFGLRFAESLGVLMPLAIMAAITIIYGSLRALAQDDLKRRLAYSTVSQLSYIALGTAIVGALSTMGGLVHLIHQGVMKITLFLCAGVLAETLGIHKVSEMRGVGRRMPLTMAAFSIAAFGMIGVPPVAGFVSKWYLGLGAAQAGQEWVIAILVTSSMLNALYFLPILRSAWFCEPDAPWSPRETRMEGNSVLVLAAVAPAVLALLSGVLAGMPWSPLSLAQRAVEGVYLP
jgi:multicomponent Na+:H+ antiporter subunit D